VLFIQEYAIINLRHTSTTDVTFWIIFLRELIYSTVYRNLCSRCPPQRISSNLVAISALFVIYFWHYFFELAAWICLIAFNSNYRNSKKITAAAVCAVSASRAAGAC